MQGQVRTAVKMFSRINSGLQVTNGCVMHASIQFEAGLRISKSAYALDSPNRLRGLGGGVSGGGGISQDSVNRSARQALRPNGPLMREASARTSPENCGFHPPVRQVGFTEWQWASLSQGWGFENASRSKFYGPTTRAPDAPTPDFQRACAGKQRPGGWSRNHSRHPAIRRLTTRLSPWG